VAIVARLYAANYQADNQLAGAYTSDADGNLLCEGASSNLMLTWNEGNELAEAHALPCGSMSVVDESYVYDALGRRVTPRTAAIVRIFNT
jgi:hypothetical protein